MEGILWMPFNDAIWFLGWISIQSIGIQSDARYGKQRLIGEDCRDTRNSIPILSIY